MRESKFQSRRRTAVKLMLGQHGSEAGVGPERLAALKSWSEHPWNFLTGVDPLTDKPIYWTKDEGDKITPIKKFPVDWEYIYHLSDVFVNEEIVVVEKARQMFMTTFVLGMMFWDCLFHDARRWLISKITEDDAIDLLRDKIRFPYSRLPPWFQGLYQASGTPSFRMDFSGTSSYIKAVAENAAIGDLRGGTASGVLCDEAAFQRELPKIWAASTPMAAKIILLTTTEVGNPGARWFRKLLMEQI